MKTDTSTNLSLKIQSLETRLLCCEQSLKRTTDHLYRLFAIVEKLVIDEDIKQSVSEHNFRLIRFENGLPKRKKASAEAANQAEALGNESAR